MGRECFPWILRLRSIYFSSLDQDSRWVWTFLHRLFSPVINALIPRCVITLITLVLLYWLTGCKKQNKLLTYTPLCDHPGITNYHTGWLDVKKHKLLTPHCVIFFPTPHCVTFVSPPWQLEGAQRAACWPAVCQRTARSGCCCWRQGEMTEVCPSSPCPWRAWTSDVPSTTGTIQQCHKSTLSKAWRGRYCVFMLLVVYWYLYAFIRTGPALRQPVHEKKRLSFAMSYK